MNGGGPYNFVELCHCSFGFYNSNKHYSRTQKNIIPLSFQNQSRDGETITTTKNEGILKANLHKAWATTAIPSAYHFTQQKLQKAKDF